METPKLVASDVDGTLLDTMDRVSRRTAAAIERTLAAGTAFVLVSGRPARWIPDVARAAGVSGYAVCGNGAVLYDIAADRVLLSHQMDPVLLGDVAHAMTVALPTITVAVERVGDSATALGGYEFLTEEAYRHPWADPDVRTAPRGELLGKPAVKLLFRDDRMTSDELAAIARDLVGDAVDITFSSDVMIEVSARGVTKGTGLAEVAGRIGVAAADVVAFGDMPNDVPMLRWAGLGVAMGNSHPDTLAAADEVTLSNTKDGVAAVLERWF
ncbi:MAG TPA: HAD family hydrolase [Pseudonocardiaceae bacterium]